MTGLERGAFDPETISLMKTALEEAWVSLVPSQQALMSRTMLAERILHLAAQGERDPVRLRASALIGLVPTAAAS